MTNLLRPSSTILSILTSRSALLFCVLALFSSLQYVLATDIAIDSNPPEDHNHHRLPLHNMDVGEEAYVERLEESDTEQLFVQYEAEFLGEDQGILGRRELSSADHFDLGNNQGVSRSLLPGQSLLFRVPNDTIHGEKTAAYPGLPSVPFPDVDLSGSNDNPNDNDLDNMVKRQDSSKAVMLYITINTCNQPLPKKAIPAPFPQLTMYVSPSTPSPGPKADSNDQKVLPLEQGFANYSLSVDSDVYVAVYPPEGFTSDFTGQWFFEIGASIDAPYHNWNNWEPETHDSTKAWNPLLYLDSDTTSSLLITQNFTSNTTSEQVNQEWLKVGNPFTLFAFPNASAIEGLSHSFCGINKAAELLGKAPGNTTTTVTTRGNGGLPKGQFYMQNLNGGSNYTVMMAMQGNSTLGASGVVGGGGQIWPNITFATKSNNNCALVFNLPFCSEVAWSVPSNPSTNLSELVRMYDNYTQYYFQQFNNSMQQIACDTTDTARYSLATNCQNCSMSYKNWLCAVALPRCDDFGPVNTSSVGVVESIGFPRNLAQSFPNGTSVTDSSLTTDLQRANLNESWLDRIYSNQSRVPGLIDEDIKPGPYLEVLPCEDLCYALVRDCPSAMGFACPLEQPSLGRSYAAVGKCNSPGNVFVPSVGTGLTPSLAFMAALVSIALFYAKPY